MTTPALRAAVHANAVTMFRRQAYAKWRSAAAYHARFETGAAECHRFDADVFAEAAAIEDLNRCHAYREMVRTNAVLGLGRPLTQDEQKLIQDFGAGVPVAERIRPEDLEALRRRANDLRSRPRWPEENYGDAQCARAIFDLISFYEEQTREEPAPRRFPAQGQHNQDSDCDVDPETELCRGCGVAHGDPCSECGGRGFHKDGCPSLTPPVPRSPPTARRCPVGSFTLRIGDETYVAVSLEAAVGIYCTERDLSGEGASTFPNGYVTPGNHLGNFRVAYNGTLFDLAGNEVNPHG